jgi:phosphotransferase system HPr (HPr) family protein
MNGAPLQRRVLLTNPSGLHMRPSAAFVELAGKFESCILVVHGERSANGKSIWDLMTLAAEAGSVLTLEADGPDASAALEALSALLSTPPTDN